MKLDSTVLIAVDFDGTLTTRPVMGDSKPVIDSNAFHWLKKMMLLDAEFILYTCREWESLEEAIEVCRSNGVVFDYINQGNGKRGDSRKVNADFYIDDRATLGKINWEMVYHHVENLIEERKEVQNGELL